MVQRLLHFLDASPVNFLATRNIASELQQAGYRRFDPREALGEVKAGDKPELGISQEEILDFDLYLADATPACSFGVHDEFISSGRLDDLSMCFAGLEAMIATETVDATKVLAIFDNEETGSQTKQGAGSPFLSMMLKRIALAQSGSEEAFARHRPTGCPSVAHYDSC